MEEKRKTALERKVASEGRSLGKNWVIRPLEFPLLHIFSKGNNDQCPKMSSFL